MRVNKGTLIVISEAISKIEDKDSDYTNNEVWKKLKEIEESAYKVYAMQEIDRNKEKVNCEHERVRKDAKEIIDACNDFLGVYDGKNKWDN